MAVAATGATEPSAAGPLARAEPTGNQELAATAVPVVPAAQALGGGVYNETGAKLTLINDLFFQNSANGGGGGGGGSGNIGAGGAGGNGGSQAGALPAWARAAAEGPGARVGLLKAVDCTTLAW